MTTEQGAQVPSGRRPFEAVALVLASAVIGLVYAVKGSGYVLDDWFILRDAHFGGWSAAGDHWRSVRPGGAAVYDVMLGLIGRRPRLLIMALTAVNIASALLLWLLARRLLSARTAFWVALVWVVMPTRTSLEVWGAASNIAVSLALALAALALLTSPRSKWWTIVLGGVLCLAAGLTYEAPIPALAVACVLLPRLTRSRLGVAATAAGLLGCVASVAWTLSHPDGDKDTRLALEDLQRLPDAIGGSGIFRDTSLSSVLLLAFLVLVTVALWRLATDLSSVDGRLVLAGLVVALCGVAPFLVYSYVPIGFGDRANVVVSIGGALIWVGIFQMVWRFRSPLAVAGAALLLVGIVDARFDRAETWATAGADAERVVADLPVALGHPAGDILVGPKPIIRGNVAAFLDSSNIDAAAQIAYDDPTVRARMSFTDEAFLARPKDSRYDLRVVSRLVPNMEIYPPTDVDAGDQSSSDLEK